jgi:hypothetical protein
MRQKPSLSLMAYIAVVAFILALFKSGSPFAIPRLVISIIVDALNG